MSDDIVYGWHFIDESGRAHGGYVPPPVGEWEPPIDNPEPCLRGYHGSPTILAALRYANGPILGRCEYRGVVWHDDGRKFAARERRCVARVDASRLLWYFAAHVAEEAMHAAKWTDPRSWAATRAARDFADGKISDAALAAARAAALAAARDVAGAAAGAAALAAAGAAALAAAGAAARAAAWAAARDVAGAAAWDVACSRQATWLDAAALDLDVEPAWTGGGE